jgi:hypothetical protein
MSAEAKTGIIPFGDGSACTWSRQESAEEEAVLLKAQAEAHTYRVTTMRDRPDGAATLAQYNVPGHWLHGFSYAMEDSSRACTSASATTTRARGR